MLYKNKIIVVSQKQRELIIANIRDTKIAKIDGTTIHGRQDLIQAIGMQFDFQKYIQDDENYDVFIDYLEDLDRDEYGDDAHRFNGYLIIINNYLSLFSGDKNQINELLDIFKFVINYWQREVEVVTNYAKKHDFSVLLVN